MIISTTPSLEGRRVREYKGVGAYCSKRACHRRNEGQGISDGGQMQSWE